LLNVGKNGRQGIVRMTGISDGVQSCVPVRPPRRGDAAIAAAATTEVAGARVWHRRLASTLPNYVTHMEVTAARLQPTTGRGCSKGGDSDSLAPLKSVSRSAEQATTGNLRRSALGGLWRVSQGSLG
jgi:hypothetical protein